MSNNWRECPLSSFPPSIIPPTIHHPAHHPSSHSPSVILSAAKDLVQTQKEAPAVPSTICHPELPFTSHKRRIAETWDPAWGAGNSEFQTAAKDLVRTHKEAPAVPLVTNAAFLGIMITAT